jgi:hypothetical protein
VNQEQPASVRSHLPRCRGVGLLAVLHQLPLGRRVGAFQGSCRQVRSSDTPQAHRIVDTDPKRGYVVVRVTGTRHDEPTDQVRQSLPNTQEVPGHGWGRCWFPCDLLHSDGRHIRRRPEEARPLIVGNLGEARPRPPAPPSCAVDGGACRRQSHSPTLTRSGDWMPNCRHRADGSAYSRLCAHAR